MASRKAVFTRNSVAYKQDGTQVASNVPRFEPGKFAQAVMVEEGTTNLTPDGGAESGTALYKDYAERSNVYKYWGSYSHRLRMSENWNGVYLCNPRTFNAGETYTISVRIKNPTSMPGYVNIYGLDFGTGGLQGKSVPANMDWTLYTWSFTVSATQGGHVRIEEYNFGGTTSDWLYIDNLQLEQKPYATSFVDGTRSPETLTIPL